MLYHYGNWSLLSVVSPQWFPALMCCIWQCQSFKSVKGCRTVRNLHMSEDMKAKQGHEVHKTTYCDRDWENEDTSEEMGRGGESSTVRMLVGRAEGAIKAGVPDRLEQESKAKYLIGIKCPDRVRGWLNSAKRAAFPLAKKKKWKRDRREKIIENPLAFE